MKKNFFAVLFLLLTASAIAQDDDGSGVRFGLNLSPQITWLSAGDKNIQSDEMAFGFSYGLLMDFLFATNYAFNTGLIVSHSGGTIIYEDATKFNTFGEDSTFLPLTGVDYNLQYLEIPLNIKLRTNEIGYITYFGQFGAQLGFRIGSKADILNPSGTVMEEKVDFAEDVTAFDAGLLVGGGLEYTFTGNTALIAGLQYYNGFVDATNNPSGFKTQVTRDYLRLLLGFYF